MDASSVSMMHPTADGKSKKEWRVDVPMRSFQGGTSHFFHILQDLTFLFRLL